MPRKKRFDRGRALPNKQARQVGQSQLTNAPVNEKVEVSIANWFKRLFDGFRDLKNGSLYTAFLMMSASAAAGYSWNATENRDLNLKLRQYEFTSRLYKILPGDVDFIARGLRLDKKAGAQLRLLGPTDGDSLTIQLSELKQETDGTNYVAYLTFATDFGGNHVDLAGRRIALAASRGSHVGPITVGPSCQLFLFVESVNIDSITVAIGRRKAHTALNISESSFSDVGGDDDSPVRPSGPSDHYLIPDVKGIPRPILRSAPSE